ncbi:glutamate-rich protein 6B-like [Panthera uncia]|uniref:glutamate-rich protein 6B-like n=1 Tax=Panthera uncia TaxID=29064 RepID=UPI0020FF7C24|nr:glutamate-rich protein 6B-like [Panthera uncia]
MSAENDQSSRGTSPLRSATMSQNSTQTISSEEDIEEEECSEKDYLFPEEEEYLEEKEYLEEDDYLEEEKLLKGKAYLYGEGYAKAGERLQEEKDLEEEYLLGKYLEDEFNMMYSWKNLPVLTREPAQGTTFYAATPFISELSHESPYHDAMPSTSSVQQDGELLAWHDESTQTEWIYETKLAPAKSKSKLKLSTTTLTTAKSDLEVCATPDVAHEEESGKRPA